MPSGADERAQPPSGTSSRSSMPSGPDRLKRKLDDPSPTDRKRSKLLRVPRREQSGAEPDTAEPDAATLLQAVEALFQAIEADDVAHAAR